MHSGGQLAEWTAQSVSTLEGPAGALAHLLALRQLLVCCVLGGSSCLDVVELLLPSCVNDLLNLDLNLACCHLTHTADCCCCLAGFAAAELEQPVLGGAGP